MPDLFLNYKELESTEEFFGKLKAKNQEWISKNQDIIDQMLTQNMGTWVGKFDGQETSVIAEFMNFSNDVVSMDSALQRAMKKEMAMLNRCGKLIYTLDGIAPKTKYSEDGPEGEIADWAKYDSTNHDTIIDNCESVMTDSASQRDALSELEEMLGPIKMADLSKVKASIADLKVGLTKQEYIDYFEQSFSSYASEVDDFNTTISSALSGLVNEEYSATEFTRDTEYEDMLEKIEKEKIEAWVKGWYDGVSDNPKYQETLNNLLDPQYEEYLRRLYEAYCNASPEARAAFDKYIGLMYIASCDARNDDPSAGAEAWFSPSDYGLWLTVTEALENEANGQRSAAFVFYHEFGHLIMQDSGALTNGEADMLRDAIEADVDNYLEDFENLVDGIPGEGARQLIAGWLIGLSTGNPGKYTWIMDNPGVADMMDGATLGDYGYGHTAYGEDANGQTYWERDNTLLPNETFANIYAMEMSGDTEQLEYLKECFPHVYEAYRQILDSAA